MNESQTTINDYINALQERSNQVGGLDYAMGYLYGSLTSLQLQQYELDRLKMDTKILKDLTVADK